MYLISTKIIICLRFSTNFVIISIISSFTAMVNMKSVEDVVKAIEESVESEPSADLLCDIEDRPSYEVSTRIKTSDFRKV
jgi:hypothetical protein